MTRMSPRIAAVLFGLIFTGVLSSCACGAVSEREGASGTSLPRDAGDVPEVIAKLIANRDGMQAVRLGGGDIETFSRLESLTPAELESFAQYNAALLRGKRIMYWTDRCVNSSRRWQQGQFMIPPDQYYTSIGVAERAPFDAIVGAYSPLLLDRDEEVRHLGAHTLLLANLIREEGSADAIAELRDFCTHDSSRLVQGLTDPEHYIYWLGPAIHNRIVDKR